MGASTRVPARPLALVAALVLLVLSMGVTGNASADPGNGNGIGQANGQAASGQANGQDGVGAVDPSTSAGTQTGTSSGGSDHSQGNASPKGSYKEPQPLSNADQNSGGANGQCPGGPYCSTRDGSPSGNGNGVGKAVGKPCAGCVGKADNKNPKGQYPNGSDHNAGYECDRNHGIGQTNPAHTGCKAVTPPPVKPPVTPPPPVKPPVTPPNVVPPAVTPPSVTPPEVAPAEVVPAVHHAPQVLGEQALAQPQQPAAVAPAAGVLPPTGADSGTELLGLAGLALVLVGAATLVLRRRSV